MKEDKDKDKRGRTREGGKRQGREGGRTREGGKEEREDKGCIQCYVVNTMLHNIMQCSK